MASCADVMPVDDRADSIPDPTPLSPDLQRLLAYWQGRRGPRRYPARADIDPLDLGYLIGRLALIELKDQGPRYYVRVWSGAHVVRYGVDLTGKCLDVACMQDAGCMPTADLDRCAEISRPVLGTCTAERNGEMKRWESLALPLGERRTTMLLVGLVALTPPA